MSSLVLIPWAETVWSAAGRIAGRTPLPLTQAGQNQALSWAQSIVPYVITQVFSSDEKASIETARIIARKLGATHKTIMDVAEVDPGLWDGLTFDELKRRHAKVFKKWYQDPSSVCPPEGEDLGDASSRICGAIERIMRKNGTTAKAVVLGPSAFSLARCWIEQVGSNQVRAMAHDGPMHYDLDALAAIAGTAPADKPVDGKSKIGPSGVGA